MKNFLIGFVVVFAFVGASFAGSDGGLISKNWLTDVTSAANTNVIVLAEGRSDTAKDSLTAAKIALFPPFPLGGSKFKIKPSYFRCYAGSGVVASGDSIEISYQKIASNSIGDTTSTWVAFDTISSGGKAGNVVNISTTPGQSIVFRVKNIDATGVLIAKPIRICFLTSAQLEVKQ